MWVLWSKIYFIRNSFWKFYEVRSERGISIDANSGTLRYVLWCCGSICHQLLNFIQIGYDLYALSWFKCDFKKTSDLLWRNTVSVYFVNNVTLVGKVIQEKRRGLFLDIFLHEKKRRKESQHPIFFALFVHFAKWLLTYLVHVFNTLEKYAMKARFACSTFSTAMTHFCT